MGSSNAFLEMVQAMTQAGEFLIACPIHGRVDGRPVGDPRSGNKVCPQCYENAVAEYVGSVGGHAPQWSSVQEVLDFVASWQRRHGRGTAANLIPGPEGPKLFDISLVSAPKCATCGKDMQAASDLEWKCGNVLCDSFSVPIHVGVYPVRQK